MIDFSDIRGQAPAIESLATAIASGARRVLFVGTPTLGPGMIARRVPTLFPPLTDHERSWLEAERDGMVGAYDQGTAIDSRPFFTPHPSIRHEYLLGGNLHIFGVLRVCRDIPEPRTICHCGHAFPAHVFHALPESVVPRAGWLHRARFGVLVLDPIDEFSSDVLRSLARCLDQMSGAPFIVATAKPCACGWHGSRVQDCICGELSRQLHAQRVQKRISILEISSKVEIPFVSLHDMKELPPGESSATLRARIEAMRAGRTAEGLAP